MKRADISLDKINVFLKSLDSVSNYGLLITDENMKIIYYNEASEKHDQLKAADVIGRYFFDVFTQKKESSVLNKVHTSKTEVLDAISTYPDKHGVMVHAIQSTYPILDNGNLLGTLSILRYNDNTINLAERLQELQNTISQRSRNIGNGTSYTLDDIQGNSAAIQETISLARRASKSYSNIMIYGETGTGKELFAQGIHNASLRHDSPFIAINCSAIPETLLESMFFGTVKGAFTGAVDSPGIFENAKNGTVLLDEINSMPISLQGKLLRVLQEKVVTRLGSNKLIPVDCSIISTSNEDLFEAVQRGQLREDLFYRLSVITIRIPPLRERQDDILVLAKHFIKAQARIYGRKPLEISDELRNALMNHKWPGNIRELQHAIEHMVAFSHPYETMLNVHHLPEYLKQQTENLGNSGRFPFLTIESNMPEKMNLKNELESYEKKIIIDYLEKNNGNLSQTAKDLGYTRSNLQFRIKKLEITLPRDSIL